MNEELKGLDGGEGEPVLIDLGESGKTEFVNLQLVMVSSSMNHEYTRKAMERTRSYEKKQRLLARMSQLKTVYFTARQKLVQTNSDRLESIEKELRHQKLAVFSESTLQ